MTRKSTSATETTGSTCTCWDFNDMSQVITCHYLPFPCTGTNIDTRPSLRFRLHIQTQSSFITNLRKHEVGIHSQSPTQQRREQQTR